MLPNFRADGLVITRTREHYKVGDVVAYHNGDLHAVVMHRIVAERSPRYVFKGDNNDFRDRYEASPADIVGKEWVYLPTAGRYVAPLRDPFTFGALIAGITAMSFLGMKRSRRRRRHHAW